MRGIAASVSEGFCTLIHGWEGEFDLPFLDYNELRLKRFENI